MAAPVEREFVGDAASPAAARAFASAAVAELIAAPVPPDLRDDLELVVSELVTNAVRAGSPTAVVTLAIEGDRLVVHVTDAAGGFPQPREAGIHDTTGRGLALVSAVSVDWGVRTGDSGKTVWAELPLAGA